MVVIVFDKTICVKDTHLVGFLFELVTSPTPTIAVQFHHERNDSTSKDERGDLSLK